MTLFLIDQDKSYVYVLKLRARNRYYVGYSSELTKRLDSHIKGKGAEYTKKHGVERIVALIECNDPGRAKELETQLTDFFMKVYGKQNVRGAAFTSSKDKDDATKKSKPIDTGLQKEEKPSKQHECTECGRPIRHRGKCMGCNIAAKRERDKQERSRL